jgi:predicted metalloprotease
MTTKVPMTEGKRRRWLAALVAAVLATLLAACSVGTPVGAGSPAPRFPPAGAGSPISPPTSAADEPRYITAVFDDAQADWRKAFAAADMPYSPAKLTMFDSAIQTACGTESADVGPFYCPADSTVYLDLSFFDQMEQQYGAGGAFAQAYVIAHEMGHHVQAISGTSGRVSQLQARNPSAANRLSVMTELQADCYAGVWAHSTYQRGLIGPAEIDQAVKAAGVIGDDYQQQAAFGRTDPQQWTHGSSQQRQHWLSTGYDTGQTSSCNTFSSLS